MNQNCNGSSNYTLCLRCDLHDLSAEMIPEVVSWTRASPRYMHALFLESCWIHNFALQFSEASNVFLFLRDIAASIGTSNFLLAVLRVSLYSSSSGSIK